MSGSLVPALGALFPYVRLPCPTSLDGMVSVFPRYVLFCRVFCLLSLRSLSFSNERQKESGSEGRGEGEEMGEVERGETVVRIYRMRKVIYFQ